MRSKHHTPPSARTRSLRSRAASAALAALLPLSACLLDDGDPWGRAEISLSTSFADTAPRAIDDGWLRTASDYAVRVDELSISFTDTALRFAVGGASLAFDPANPPPGYTLCHNGHCHADDGRLVDYEDIALELSGGTPVEAPEVRAAVNTKVALLPAPFPLPVDCPDGCALPEGSIASIEVRASSARIRGVVRDLRDGERNRLLQDTVAFDIEWPNELRFASPLSGRTGRHTPLHIRVRASLEVSVRVLDALRWERLASDDPASLSQLEDEFAFALGEHVRLTVLDVRRD
jgi:hypothetical protein